MYFRLASFPPRRTAKTRENFRDRRSPRKLSRSVHVFAVGSSVRSLANSVLSRPAREVLFRSTFIEKAFRVLE